VSDTQTQPLLPSQLGFLPPGEVSGTLPMELRCCGGLLGAPGPLTGQLVEDRYLVLDRLDEDERRTRYRVRHVRMQKELVLEVLRTAPQDSKAVDGFQRRLRSASGLDHPAVPPVNDAGRLPNGAPYLILERPGGETLRERLEREGRLPVPLSVDIALQLCRALSHLHEAGLVQGHLTPDQVVLRPGHLYRDEARLLHLGEPGSPGSPRRGPREDVRAVGALLYEMITGEAPTPADAPASRWGRRRPTPALRSRVTDGSVPTALDRVVQRALQPHPADRYATMGRLHEALDRLGLVPAPRGAWVRGLAIPLPGGVSPAPRPKTRRRRRPRSRGLLWGSLTGALVATTLALVGLARTAPSRAGLARYSTHAAGTTRAQPRQLRHLRQLLSRGRIRDAAKTLGHLVDHHPADAQVHLVAGHLHRLQRHPLEALHDYRRAVRLDPRLTRSPELLSAVSQLLTFTAGRDDDAAVRRQAMAFVHRYLGVEAAPLVTRYVNTWWEAEQVWRGILFLLRFGRDQQVDYLYAYELLLRTDRSCYRRRTYLQDIVARRDPRFLGLMERVVATPGWRAPHTGHWIRNTCIQPAARAAVASLRTLPQRAVAVSE